MAIVSIQESTHVAVKKGFSTDIELASFHNVSGSAAFAVVSGGSFQYEVMAFFSATEPSPVFVVFNSNPVDLRSVLSSGLGPSYLGATITTSLGNYLLSSASSTSSGVGCRSSCRASPLCLATY